MANWDLPRLHLFEFEDQPWFPATIRDYMTDFLGFVSNLFDFYKGAIPLLVDAIQASGGNTIVDLASGGGGGYKRIAQHLMPQVPRLRVIVTDLYPNRAAFQRLSATHPGVFVFEERPVDARQVPDHLKGVRTQLLSFHHFPPAQAQQILQNAVDAGQPIVILEAQRRDAQHVIKNALSLISVLLTTPFIRPFKLGRLVFTYLIPLVPLFVLWDGVVSVLRTYSVEEMQAMVDGLRGGDRYVWQVGELKSGQVTLPHLAGWPKPAG